MNQPEPTEQRSIKPLPAHGVEPNVYEERDHAKAGWSLVKLEGMLADIDHQPNYWRDRADFCAGYVDGKQFSDKQEQALLAEGLEDLRPTNLVGRVLRSICGQEAKSRSDVKVEADDDDEADVCEVLNQDMKEARREAKVDMAVSAAYAGQAGIGIGWVKVDTAQDPLDYRHRVRFIDRRKVWWDWNAQDPLLKDARWLVHKEWADIDELVAAMPKHRAVLENAADSWQRFGFDEEDYQITQVNAFNDYRNFNRTRARTEWLDTPRHRIKLYEVWYRVPAIAHVLLMGPTKRVLFDETNQNHINLVVAGKVHIKKALTSQVRMSLYAGPHRLQDIGTTRRRFPYVPFFGYRDDQDQTPYGLIEGMIGPQDEYNARRIRINWLIRARQILMDHDALHLKANTFEEIAKKIMRPDLTVVLNADRINKTASAFQVLNGLQMQPEQIEVMQDAKQLIQDVPGVYGSQLGQAASGVTSGIANSLLIEQGAVAMGDLNDNYRDSRGLVHEILLDQLIDDRRAAQMKAKIGRGSSRRVVVLNDIDPETGMIINSVADAGVRAGLGDIPNTPSYRMMQQQQLASVITALAGASPQAVGVLIPSFIEATDLPDRMERAEDARKALGIPTAGDKQAQAAAEKAAAQQQEQEQAMAAEAAALTLAELQAKVELLQSQANLNEAKTVELGHGLGMRQIEHSASRAPQPADPAAEQSALIDSSIAEAMQPQEAMAA